MSNGQHLEPADVITLTVAEAKPATDLNFKADLLAVMDGEFQPTEKEGMLHLIDEYEDVFSKEEYDFDIVAQTIYTGDHRPTYSFYREISSAAHTGDNGTDGGYLRQDLTELVVSEWTSNVVVIKKDGKLHFCIDYRRHNEANRKDSYPLPHTDSCLNAMAGARWFRRTISGLAIIRRR